MLGLCGWVQLNSRFTQPTVRALREAITVFDLINYLAVQSKVDCSINPIT